MDARTFRALREIAYEQAGIALRENKEALVGARIAKRVRELGLGSPSDYLAYLKADRTGDEMIQFLDAISTNFTSFFRERPHFEALAAHVREVVDSGKPRIRIWCAAASTGEEPYTIAMTVAEAVAGRAVDWKILATDISTRVLRHAADAVYLEHQLGPVPKALRARYFARDPRHDGRTFRVVDGLRERVVFKRLNLAKPPFPLTGRLDALFCRNVMIYFDQEVRQRLVSELERVVLPEGLLVIGHSETLSGVETRALRMTTPSVYRRALGSALTPLAG